MFHPRFMAVRLISSRLVGRSGLPVVCLFSLFIFVLEMNEKFCFESLYERVLFRDFRLFFSDLALSSRCPRDVVEYLVW